MSGYQSGALNRSSIWARVSDSVLPGAVFGLLSSREGGCTFSVTGNAQSGRSAATAALVASTRMTMQAARTFESSHRHFGRRHRFRRVLSRALRALWAGVSRMTTRSALTSRTGRDPLRSVIRLARMSGGPSAVGIAHAFGGVCAVDSAHGEPDAPIHRLHPRTGRGRLFRLVSRSARLSAEREDDRRGAGQRRGRARRLLPRAARGGHADPGALAVSRAPVRRARRPARIDPGARGPWRTVRLHPIRVRPLAYWRQRRT